MLRCGSLLALVGIAAAQAPPPPTAAETALLYQTNLAWLKTAAYSSAVAGPASAAAALSHNSSDLGPGGVPGYTNACAGPPATSYFQSIDNDPSPYFQVDLGAVATVNQVQLWTVVSSSDWLDPITILVCQTASCANGQYVACFGSANPGSVASLPLGTCQTGTTGRYVTVQLTGNNTMHPTQRSLRICSLMVFGSFLPGLPALPPPSPNPPPPRSPPPNPPPPVNVASTANDTLSWYVILAFTIPSAVVFLIACFLVWRYGAARWRERRAAQEKKKRYMRMALAEWRGRTSDWDTKAPHGFGPASPAPDRTKHHVPTFLGEPAHSPLAGAYAAGEVLVEIDKSRRGPPIEMGG